MGLVPQARHFPSRNRLISGLAEAVIVIEAAAKSGSLITARSALDQGREVMAVPGHPIDARASGCNMLIRDGATLVRSAADVIEALPQTRRRRVQAEMPLDPAPQPDVAPQRGLRETAALHTEILQRLGPSPLAEDQLIRDLGAPPARSPRCLSISNLTAGSPAPRAGFCRCRADPRDAAPQRSH